MSWDSTRQTIQTAVIWILLVAGAIGLWEVRTVLLLIFGAVLVAILLRTIAAWIAALTRLPVQVGLALATVLLIATVALFVWLFGSQLSGQLSDVFKHAKAGESYLKSVFEKNSIEQFGNTVTQKGTSIITNIATRAFSAGFQFIAGLLVTAISAIYLAAQPQLYRRGIAYLVPARTRSRALATVDLIGRTLKLWMLAQLLLMMLVALLSFVALMAIALPNPAALALIAGLCEAVPYVGPFIGAIPALLVALTIGLVPALWTAGSYLCIHLFEGYIATPLIERYFVTIPPVVILIGIVTVTLLFGTIGIVLAAPITVMVYIAVKAIYSDDPLNEHVADS